MSLTAKNNLVSCDDHSYVNVLGILRTKGVMLTSADCGACNATVFTASEFTVDGGEGIMPPLGSKACAVDFNHHGSP